MKTVSLHIPCLVDLFMPDTGKSVIRLLDRIGAEHVYHDAQTCCGMPAFNAGFRPESRQAAKHFIKIFGDDEVIVSPSGSCVEMVKLNYPELLKDEPKWHVRAVDLASRTFEFTQYLVDVLGLESVGGCFNGKVAYHESCRLLRGLGVSEQPKKLIRAMEGVEFVDMVNGQDCCGFGGEFSHKYSDISQAMAADKIKGFLESGADVLTMAEPGCFLNLSGYVSRNHPEQKVMHIADLLAGSFINA